MQRYLAAHLLELAQVGLAEPKVSLHLGTGVGEADRDGLGRGVTGRAVTLKLKGTQVYSSAEYFCANHVARSLKITCGNYFDFQEAILKGY